jgi:hypothetical protein
LKSKFKKEEPIKEDIKEKVELPLFEMNNADYLKDSLQIYYASNEGKYITNLRVATIPKLKDYMTRKNINMSEICEIYAEVSLKARDKYIKEIDEINDDLKTILDKSYRDIVGKKKKLFESRVKRINKEIPDEYKEELNKMKGGFLFNGLSMNAIGSMPPNVKTLLDKYGDAKISNIKLNKTPVQGAVQFLLNKFSKGGNSFQQELSKLPYDSIYHLQMIFTTDKGRVVLEKNERVNMAERPKETEILNVPFNSNLTIRQIYDNALKLAGEKLFYSYNASSNNCQNFVIFLLKGSNLLTPQSQEFTKQDTSSLFQKDPRLRKIANSFVKIGSVIDATMQGGELQIKKRGRPKKYYID